MGGLGGGPLDEGPPFGPATWWLNGRMLEGLPCRCGQMCVCVYLCVYVCMNNIVLSSIIILILQLSVCE